MNHNQEHQNVLDTFQNTNSHTAEKDLLTKGEKVLVIATSYDPFLVF